MNVDRDGVYYHGTDVSSALALLNSTPLDAVTAAANTLDGPLGCYLVTDVDDAEYFALPRSEGTVLRVAVSALAHRSPEYYGVVVRPIPFGGGVHFSGSKRYVPPGALDEYHRLRQAGEIRVEPYFHQG